MASSKRPVPAKPPKEDSWSSYVPAEPKQDPQITAAYVQINKAVRDMVRAEGGTEAAALFEQRQQMLADGTWTPEAAGLPPFRTAAEKDALLDRSVGGA